MEWYLRELFRDRRFRISAAVAIGSILFMLLGVLAGRAWTVQIAEFVFLPLLGLSVGMMFFVFWKIVRSSYLERKGSRAGK
jgi:hypothetical protein